MAAGEAVLVDIREPSECADGVIAGALVLPMSDLKGSQQLWSPALSEHANKEWLIYCRSGARAAAVTEFLKQRGIRATNVGGYSSWKSAGAPVTTP